MCPLWRHFSCPRPVGYFKVTNKYQLSKFTTSISSIFLLVTIYYLIFWIFFNIIGYYWKCFQALATSDEWYSSGVGERVVTSNRLQVQIKSLWHILPSGGILKKILKTNNNALCRTQYYFKREIQWDICFHFRSMGSTRQKSLREAIKIKYVA